MLLVWLRVLPQRCHESSTFLRGSGPCAGADQELFFYTRDLRRGEPDVMVMVHIWSIYGPYGYYLCDGYVTTFTTSSLGDPNGPNMS